MKRARQTEILNIIQSVDVETQEQLLDELRARGYSATQATISRDIKELRLVKELVYGGYRYASSDRRGLADSDIRLRNILRRASPRWMWRRISWWCGPCRVWPPRPAQPWTIWTYRAWWPVWRGDDVGILIMRDNDLAEQFIQEVHKLLK